MVEPSLTDCSRAEALVRQAKAGFFGTVIDYGAYIFIAIILGVVIFDQLHNYLPSDLPLIAQNITLFIGLPICSIFLLRKQRSKHDRELEVIYAEFFHEGLEEEQVREMVRYGTFMYILLPVRPAVKEERLKLLLKFKKILVLVLTGLGIYFSVEGAGSQSFVQQLMIGFFGGVYGFVAGILIAWAPELVIRILRQIL